MAAVTVEVVLEANAPVAAGYGVSDLTTGNYTITGVAQDTSSDLAIGEQVTITFTGDVADRGTNFNLWFSICSTTPVSASCGCPTFTLLHEFTGGASDGRYPHSQRLTLPGSTPCSFIVRQNLPTASSVRLAPSGSSLPVRSIPFATRVISR